MTKALTTKAITMLILLSIGYNPALAQVGGTGKITVPTGGESKPKNPARRDKKYNPVADAAKAELTTRTGSLTVVAEAGATVFLEPLSGQKRSKNQQGRVQAGRRSFIFNDLEPGRYQVSVELDGYEDAAGKDGERAVNIIPNKTESVDFRLRPIIYDVTLTTNVKTGKVEYGSRERGRMVLGLQNGRVMLPGLPAGTYDIEISPTEIGYSPQKSRIEVGAGRTTFDIKLERRLSETPLSANWTSLTGWEAPPGWSVATRKLVVKGKGLALPSNEHLRHYADFELVSDIKMINDVAASFVLRAQDNRNYYLVQITGGKADEPYVLRGFVVQSGVAKELSSSIPVSGYAHILSSGHPFALTIKCVGNKFIVSITDSQTGDEPTLGTLTDFDRRFASGAPGIAVRDQEQNEITRFVVNPLSNNPR